MSTALQCQHIQKAPKSFSRIGSEGRTPLPIRESTSFSDLMGLSCLVDYEDYTYSTKRRCI